MTFGFTEKGWQWSLESGFSSRAHPGPKRPYSWNLYGIQDGGSWTPSLLEVVYWNQIKGVRLLRPSEAGLWLLDLGEEQASFVPTSGYEQIWMMEDIETVAKSDQEERPLEKSPQGRYVRVRNGREMTGWVRGLTSWFIVWYTIGFRSIQNCF